VVGAGPAGLSYASLVSHRNVVTVFEKDKVVGGRTRTLSTPEGFRFDLGPTFFLYPRVIAEIFSSVGARLEDEAKLIRVDPLYRLFFEGAASIDATADPVRMEAEIAKLCPQDAKGFRAFIAENRAKLEVFRPVLEKPFDSIFRFLHPEVLKSLPLLRPQHVLQETAADVGPGGRLRGGDGRTAEAVGVEPVARLAVMFTSGTTTGSSPAISSATKMPCWKPRWASCRPGTMSPTA
jgi:phytoene desaturase